MLHLWILCSLFIVNAGIASAESPDDNDHAGNSRLLRGSVKKGINTINTPRHRRVRERLHCDRDGDGYVSPGALDCSHLLKAVDAPTDCNDDDPAVHPSADEICGDGIDNNCNGEIDEDGCIFPRVEAENYIGARMGTSYYQPTVSLMGGKGKYRAYGPLNFGSAGTTNAIRVLYSKAYTTGGSVEFRLDGPLGPIVGSFYPKTTGDWYTWQNATIPIVADGVHDLYIVGVGGALLEAMMELDWFELVSVEETSPSEPSEVSSAPTFQPFEGEGNGNAVSGFLLSAEPSETPSASPRNVPSSTPSNQMSLPSNNIPPANQGPEPSRSSVSPSEVSVIPSSSSYSPSTEPSSPPTTSLIPSDAPSAKELIRISSSEPSAAPTPTTTQEVESPEAPLNPRSAWMSGKHGIGWRIRGGINSETALFTVDSLLSQIKGELLDNALVPNKMSYIIVGLSSGAFGDRYLAPHPILSVISRGSTPRYMPDWFEGNCKSVDCLGGYTERDLFDELLTAFDAEGIKVIAYMAVQGPALLKAGERKAFDWYDGTTVKDFTDCSGHGDCSTLCNTLRDVNGRASTNGQCSPSVRKWVQYVELEFGAFVDDEDRTAKLHQAYAEKIVGHYAQVYGDRIAGFWLDNGSYGSMEMIVNSIREFNPNAAVSYNQGSKVPLKNNNPGYEDYTFGHVVPLKKYMNPSDGGYNYGMILSAESSNNGYVYERISPSDDYSECGSYALDSSTDPTTWVQTSGCTPEDIAAKDDATYSYGGTFPSLAHVFLPANLAWNAHEIVHDDGPENIQQAREWMARVLAAGGAFTWNIKKDVAPGSAGTYDASAEYGSSASDASLLEPDDLKFLVEVYKGLPGGTEEVSPPYVYKASNAQCSTPCTSNPAYQWGCQKVGQCPYNVV